ncbi:MAG: ATP phosphoribosyltransferase regulatory subunit [Candidatus Portnoybacteria bacterium]|nr:ATP phosphoribosyltransferase regulatory subunit [Candidatus Portnoybacteria bacterium]
MNTINISPPSGTRDFLPSDLKFREKIIDATKQVFESFGFLPIETPAFERIEILTGKYGDEGEKLIFEILKRGEKKAAMESDLALRYDFTVPLARVIARYQDKLPKIFKRYQIGPIWRADRPGKNRFREFYQADIDIVGLDSVAADAEIILVLSEVLIKLGIQDFVVRLNSRKVLIGLMETLEIPKQSQNKVLIILDKIDKIGVKGVEKELLKEDLPAKVLKNIKELFKLLVINK